MNWEKAFIASLLILVLLPMAILIQFVYTKKKIEASADTERQLDLLRMRFACVDGCGGELSRILKLNGTSPEALANLQLCYDYCAHTFSTANKEFP